jgi:effector-binding domain-containing protein
MSRYIRSFVAIGLVVASGAVLLAADQKEPAKEPAKDAAGQVVGESREQTLRATAFAHVTVKTSIQKIGEVASKTLEKVAKLMSDNKIFPVGPPMFVYHGASPDPAAEFTLDIGYLVPDDAKAAGDLKVTKLEKFHCMSVLYTGSVKGIAAAYGKVYPDLSNAGHTPTSESRELFLYWEGEDSPNNVIQVSAGIQ